MSVSNALADDDAKLPSDTRQVPAEAAEVASEEPARSTEQAVAEKVGEPTIRRIGPVTTITEVSSGLPFPARVDTGATTCSIHYEEIEIENAAENPEDNVGKRVRVLIQNPDGNKQWVSTKIVEHCTVRTSTDDEQRYKVPLKLRWQDVEKKVLVTLKDREKMKYPLLLGRNFLRGDFVVDVNLDAE
ncbi:MAG: RimK/LysX family protein [Pirellulales bacterium]